MTPASHAGYRTLPPSPEEEPERPAWMTALGWLAVVGVCVLVGLFVLRLSGEADRNAAEAAEVAREAEHMRGVDGWLQDSWADPVPGSASRPVPTSDRAKRMWVVSRMMEDRAVWEREVQKRHGMKSVQTPAAWGKAPYAGNARAYPEMETHLEARAAAIAEIAETSDAWVEERIAALARESGMPAPEVRALFPADFGGMAQDEAGQADAMLEIHRHLVRVDPRVRHDGGDMLSWEREEDLRRLEALTEKLVGAVRQMNLARAKRVAGEQAALAQVFQ